MLLDEEPAVRRAAGAHPSHVGRCAGYVAAHRHTPPAAVARLATSAELKVRESAAGNPAAGPLTLLRLADDRDHVVRFVAHTTLLMRYPHMRPDEGRRSGPADA